jgi:hypothetical protein
VVSLATFEKVTGRKDEPWLVKTVGWLLTGWGALMLAGARRPNRFVAATAATPAVLMAGVDLWYAGVRRCISPIYLADAVVEVAFAVGWASVTFGAHDAPSVR